jgi:DNA-binding NarL/FixJ family response regulator
MNGVRTLPFPGAAVGRRHGRQDPAKVISIRATDRRGAPAFPISVAVVSGDPKTGQRAVSYLKTRSELNVLNAERQDEAEVVVIMVDTITEEALGIMEGFASASPGGNVRFVLVGDGMREEHVARAVSYGQVSVVSRRGSDFGQVLRAIVDVREGRLEMPGDAVGWLAGRVRRIEKDVLEPPGLNATGLSQREVEVLRMLADGMETAEIAQRLNYSERTIKNTIYAMVARLGLRNRVHAVAFAIRNNAF